MKKLKSWLPEPSAIHQNRWLRWLGPHLKHPRLWHFSRKGITLGMALGIFFGLLIPVAQIPLSATAAVLLRANLPMAVTSTLVTNPVTFGPVYFAAYKTGQFVLGLEVQGPAKQAPDDQAAAETAPPAAEPTWGERLSAFWHWLTHAGKPLVVGLALFACVGGLLTYAVISLIWTWNVRRQRARRLEQRGSDEG